MFKEEAPADGEVVDPYKGVAYQAYRWILHLCLRFRWMTVGITLARTGRGGDRFRAGKAGLFPGQLTAHVYGRVLAATGQ